MQVRGNDTTKPLVEPYPVLGTYSEPLDPFGSS